MTLLELCYNKPDRILRDSTTCFVRAHLPHFKQLRGEVIRFRLLKLFQALVKSIEVNSCDAMVTFMDKVSDERFEVGFELNEVQTAINILEESLWKMISEFVDDDKKTNAMKQVSFLLGKAKEELANEYAMLSKEYVST